MMRPSALISFFLYGMVSMQSLQPDTRYMVSLADHDLNGTIGVVWRNSSFTSEFTFICDDGIFSHAAVDVICQEIGFSGGTGEPAVPGVQVNTLQEVRCTGYEPMLENCTWTLGNSHQCNSTIAIRCNKQKDASFDWLIGISGAILLLLAWITSHLFFRIKSWKATRTRVHPVESQPSTSQGPHISRTSILPLAVLPQMKSQRKKCRYPRMSSDAPPPFNPFVLQNVRYLPPPPNYETLFAAPDIDSD
ncbi:hypothetical protein CAPTEDRAFT_222881 [Capitella teleta]|uniref:SRCR domain-containing protein n=1 Tax=Capitella teleta TaxID=283909 RepID=R7UI66_CAPTE|nr:hypothetical protein CAPTEDRAFT_222881 [Capitella teleta]|eukprot:ELU02932.1 hypothetical protein CAPTEDRAFT_222881 [Capitella teleta]